MANQWFRFYAEFSSDPKVQMMSETFQRRLMMLFCFRCNGNETLQDAEIVFQLRVSPEEWQATKAEFIARNFIDNDNRILNWDKRQYVSDSSTARVSKHREKKKQECNVSVTPPEQSRADTEQSITEKKGALPRLAVRPKNISENIWSDFIRQRKTKFTATALKGIEREVAEAGVTLEEALRTAVERGWQSFKADWVKEKGNAQSNQSKSAYDITAEIAAEYYVHEPEDGPNPNAGSPKLSYIQ